MEDDYGMIDGIINNGSKEQTVAQLEQQARSGQPISLMDLAAAAHREDRDKKEVRHGAAEKPAQGGTKKKQRPKRAQKGRSDMNAMTFEETNLLCIYNPGSRLGAIEALSEMRGHLEPDETELLALTDSTLAKLRTMTDAEFDELELYPDFDE